MYRFVDSESVKCRTKRSLHPLLAWSLAGRVVVRYSAWLLGRIGIGFLRARNVPIGDVKTGRRAHQLDRTPLQLVSGVIFSKTFTILCFATSAMAGVVYHMHLEVVPVTGRKRFNLFTTNMIEQLAEEGARHLLSESAGKLLPEDHPTHKRVERICRQLARGASSLPELHDASQVSPANGRVQ